MNDEHQYLRDRYRRETPRSRLGKAAGESVEKSVLEAREYESINGKGLRKMASLNCVFNEQLRGHWWSKHKQCWCRSQNAAVGGNHWTENSGLGHVFQGTLGPPPQLKSPCQEPQQHRIFFLG